jgi:uncharacterized membrane protein (DUF4010 family)
MVNSTATIAELAGFLAKPSENAVSIAIIIDLLTVLAMFLRNLLILAIFAPEAVPTAAAPLAVMVVAGIACLLQQRKHGHIQVSDLQLGSPLSLSKVLKFGVIFLIIEIIGVVGQRYFGHFGFLFVSAAGGLVSSASTAGAAATLALHGKITPETAGIATVLTSMTSALSNLPLLHQQIRQWRITRPVVLLSFAIVAAGLVTLVAIQYVSGG